MGRPSRYLTIAAIITTTAVIAVAPPRVEAATCAGGVSASDLTTAFVGGLERIAGADYQRAFRLPDGRRLWVFQDAFVRTPAGATPLIHNVGLVQRGACFRLLRSGTADGPRPWIGASRTTDQRRWFWPLSGTVGARGRFRLFVAEMVERGPRYLSHTEPVATWIATISLPRLRVVRLRPAPDPSSQLYGWSVVNRGAHTYLYGHCYRQFGWSPVGHAPCARTVKVARVPRGRLNAAPRYWNGVRWTVRPRRAVNIAPRRGPFGEARLVNPMQIARAGRCWIAVTKVGDWFGHSIYLDRAPTAHGPWRTAAVIPAVTLGLPSTYNTYFASITAIRGDNAVVGLSNNRWDGQLSGAYRPTFQSVPLRRWGCGGAGTLPRA